MGHWWHDTDRKNKVILKRPVPLQPSPPQILHKLLQSHVPVDLRALRRSKENVQNIAVKQSNWMWYCFSDDGCCPFVFEIYFIKTKIGKEERWKKWRYSQGHVQLTTLTQCLYLRQITQFLVPYREHPTFSLSYFAHIIILMCFSLCSVCAISNQFHYHETGIPLRISLYIFTYFLYMRNVIR